MLDANELSRLGRQLVLQSWRTCTTSRMVGRAWLLSRTHDIPTLKRRVIRPAGQGSGGVRRPRHGATGPVDKVDLVAERAAPCDELQQHTPKLYTSVFSSRHRSRTRRG